jgi:hypothetical protein
VSGLAEGVPDLDSATGSRFSLVSYLPTYAAVAFLAVLVAGGAPGGRFDPARAHERLAAVGGVELAAVVLGVVLLAVVLHPLQLPLIQFLEGYWPRPLRWLTAARVARQRTKRSALASQADPTRLSERQRDDPAARRAVLEAAWRLRRRFPPADMLLPTALGNALRAMEHDAGSAYGADTVAWWPRLYIVLGEPLRAVVDDRRDQLDATCRLAATGAAVAVITVPLLWRSGWWLAVALVPLAVAVVSYRAAVTAAVAYGEAVRTAFDLHRFDLLTRLHLGLPGTPSEELATNRRLTRFWLQGVPMPDVAFEHRPGADDRDA